jgi:hypothetical protein
LPLLNIIILLPAVIVLMNHIRWHRSFVRLFLATSFFLSFATVYSRMYQVSSISMWDLNVNGWRGRGWVLDLIQVVYGICRCRRRWRLVWADSMKAFPWIVSRKDFFRR